MVFLYRCQSQPPRTSLNQGFAFFIGVAFSSFSNKKSFVSAGKKNEDGSSAQPSASTQSSQKIFEVAFESSLCESICIYFLILKKITMTRNVMWNKEVLVSKVQGKGQIISKANIGFLNLPKNELNSLFWVKKMLRIVNCLFFGRIASEMYWPLEVGQFDFLISLLIFLCVTSSKDLARNASYLTNENFLNFKA